MQSLVLRNARKAVETEDPTVPDVTDLNKESTAAINLPLPTPSSRLPNRRDWTRISLTTTITTTATNDSLPASQPYASKAMEQEPFLPTKEKDLSEDAQATEDVGRDDDGDELPRRHSARNIRPVGRLVAIAFLVALVLSPTLVLRPLRFCFEQARRCMHHGPKSLNERVDAILSSTPLFGTMFNKSGALTRAIITDCRSRRPQRLPTAHPLSLQQPHLR
jgi:hypothetical protein